VRVAERLRSRRKEHMMAAYSAWNVYLNGKCIDTVFYDPDCDRDDVRTGLIEHDGYDPAIVVQKVVRKSEGD
jgi:hypothetical protein